jgi:hypothetical protein
LGVPYTGAIEAEAEGSTTLHGIVDVTCAKSTVGGTVVSHGAEVTAKASLSSLTLTECGSNDVTVSSVGSLEIHELSGGNGTVTSSGAQISVQVTAFGITCVYSTSNTDIGTLTATETPEGNATLDIESASIPRTGGSIFCGSSAEWTGSYAVSTPYGLTLQVAPPDAKGHFVTTNTVGADLVGKEAGTDKLEWTIEGFGAGMACEESKWKGSFQNETTSEMYLKAEFFKCTTTKSAEEVKVKMGACRFLFLIAEKTNENTGQTGFLECFNKKEPLEIVHPKCTAKVLTQHLEGMKYKQVTLNNKHALTISFATAFKNTELEGTECGAAKQAKLEGSFTVEAFLPKTNPPTQADLTAT